MCDTGFQEENLAVIDFACGPGRVASRLKLKSPSLNLFGSDIDPEAISWAKSNLDDVATFSLNRADTPSDFEDDAFDVVYSISLFTHLDTRYQDLWLAEIVRILKPGGILITSTHGADCLETCTNAERSELSAKGIVFRIDHVGRFKIDGLPDFYQTTFHTRQYVLRHWASYLSVKSYIERGVNNHQDLIVLRK